MGIWDFLTREIKVGSYALAWNEPMLCRTRLRGDLAWRIVIAVSAWLAATGVMLLIFAFNQNPPSRGVALGLGAVFGLGPAVLCLFFLKSQVSGSLKVYRDRIVRRRMYVSVVSSWNETTTWGLGGISRFHIVTSDKAGQSFHVMFFKCEGEWDLIGIPRKVDLKKLRSLLSGGGAEVTPANRVPDTFRKPLSAAVAGASGLMGAGLAIAGFVTFNPGNAPNRPQRPDIAQFQQNFPDPNLPARVDPGLPAGNPDTGNSQLPDGPNLPDNRNGGFGNPLNLFPNAPQPPTVNGASPVGRRRTSFVADESIGHRSKLVGGTGGFPFTKVSAQQIPVVGVSYRMGTWNNQEHLAEISPMYERAKPGPNQAVIIADPGYALGAIEIHAPEFVDGVRLLFMKQAPDGGLDFDDSYTSDWIGHAVAAPVRLDRGGSPIIGFHGKGGAVLDALGVVYRE